MCAVSSRMEGEARLWRWPMAKSLGSCAGVTLDGSGAELGFGPVVGEDGNLARGAAAGLSQWDEDFFADEVGVAFVGGVYGYGGVAEHGLGGEWWLR